MKRFLLVTLILILGISCFAADYYPKYSGKSTTITMWAWTSNENYSIEEFEKVYPNIKVKWENFDVHYEKAQTALSAGSGLPDVLMVEYSFAPQFMDLGAFQPINKWLDEKTFVELYGEAALGWCAADGQIYGTPQDSGALTMFYRKDLFDQYGLTVPKSMDEFIEQAKKFKQVAPSNLKYYAAPIGNVQWWIAQVWKAGGKLYDYHDGKWYIHFTNPVAKEVFATLGKCFDEGIFDLEMWWNADWFNSLNQGTTAVVENGAWFAEWLKYNAPESEGKWRVGIPPQWNPAKPTNAMLGGSGFYVTSHSKNPEAAALFVNWLNSHPTSLKCLHKYSNLPVMVSSRYEEVLDEVSGPDAFFGGQNIVESLWEAHHLVNTTFITLPISSNMDESLSLLIQQYVDGKIKRFADILPMWEKEVINTMKEFGYTNLVTGKLP
ncbi:MAG TPA: sugar ABC transporter substrate-binding protein [Firmicutes bacterium]|jgi:multiple sugar transport system substrate-binding protein|nr:sugar ABC transporter substrate-binding protein [Bacillota bacterium]